MALIEHTLSTGSSQVGLGLVMHFLTAAFAKRVFWLRALDASSKRGQEQGCRNTLVQEIAPATQISWLFH